MNAYIGIDPGASGAIAVLRRDLKNQIMHIRDMPTFKVKVSKTMRDRVDVHGCISNMREISKSYRIEMVVIEEVGGMTGQSASAAFAFGKSAGLIEAACAAVDAPIRLVRPNVWKKHFSIGADKSLTVQAATRELPQFREYWDGTVPGKQDRREGRAEAALMAMYAWSLVNARMLEAAE
jgi:Holliday junction resolvasome RuvABC endonuclease subunit